MDYTFARAVELSISLSPKEVLKEEKESFSRRLSRLWRCGFLPHEICGYLNITPEKFVSEVERLSKKQTMSPDSRKDLDFQAKRSIRARGHLEQLQLNKDYLFYRHRGISHAEVAQLLEIPFSRLKQIEGYKAKKSAQNASQGRDDSIVKEFNARVAEKGVKASLAKKYKLSRKAVDLILDKAGVVDHRGTKRKVSVNKASQAKADQICNTFEKHLKKHGGVVQKGIYAEIARTYGVSPTYVSRVLVKAGLK